MYKLAQNIYKPMAVHTPKVTNPFAGAKAMNTKIHTFATPENAETNKYFSGLWSDIKSVGEGIGNAASKVGDTAWKAAKGWDILLSPYKSTPAQKMEWFGKAVKSVGTDYIPGIFQGAINLPANTVKGVSDISTGFLNSVTGKKFSNIKNSIDNFTNSITNPFKVNFKGNRTGVAAESFGIGEFAGETAASLGAGAVTNGVKDLAAKGLNYTLPKVPKSVSSAYAKGITKLTGDPYPITGPERTVYKQMKNDGPTLMRGESPVLHDFDESYFTTDPRIPSDDLFKNRTFLNKSNRLVESKLADNLNKSNTPYKGPLKEAIDYYHVEDNPSKRYDSYRRHLQDESQLRQVIDNETGETYYTMMPTKKHPGTIFIDKKNRNFDKDFNTDEMKFYLKKSNITTPRAVEAYKKKLISTKDNPVAVFGHENGHRLNTYEDALKDANSLSRGVQPELRTPRMQKIILDEEAAANRNSLEALNKNTKWYHPTGWLRERRLKDKLGKAFQSYVEEKPLGGYHNKDMFGNILPNYAKKGIANAFKTVPIANFGKQNDYKPFPSTFNTTF